MAAFFVVLDIIYNVFGNQKPFFQPVFSFIDFTLALNYCLFP